MSERDHHAAGIEARRAVPGGKWRPDEEHRQDVLLRYLGAVASVSAAHAAENPPAPEPVGPVLERPHREGPAPIQVRDVMDVPAIAVRGDTPFLEIARTLSRERVNAVPVVDAEDRVVGVVSESDLLAKAAVEAAQHRPGALSRVRRRRLFEKAQGQTAQTLMTSPAVTVYAGTPVAEAAWLAAHSRIKRLPVVDHKGRLLGVVHRLALLQTLVRDDARIREEIETRVLRREFGLRDDAVQVTVDNGVVRLSGRVEHGRIPQLIEEIREIDDVTEVVDRLTAV